MNASLEMFDYMDVLVFEAVVYFLGTFSTFIMKRLDNNYIRGRRRSEEKKFAYHSPIHLWC